MKREQLFTIGKLFAFLAMVILLGAGAVIMTAKTVHAETYIATIDTYKANLGMMQFTHNDPNVKKKTLFFAADDKTEMYDGKKRVKLPEVWQKTKKVKIQIDKGRIQRIDVLEWY